MLINFKSIAYSKNLLYTFTPTNHHQRLPLQYQPAHILCYLQSSPRLSPSDLRTGSTPISPQQQQQQESEWVLSGGWTTSFRTGPCYSSIITRRGVVVAVAAIIHTHAESVAPLRKEEENVLGQFFAGGLIGCKGWRLEGAFETERKMLRWW